MKWPGQRGVAGSPVSILEPGTWGLRIPRAGPERGLGQGLALPEVILAQERGSVGRTRQPGGPEPVPLDGGARRFLSLVTAKALRLFAFAATSIALRSYRELTRRIGWPTQLNAG
jgi:hypothetical protein